MPTGRRPQLYLGGSASHWEVCSCRRFFFPYTMSFNLQQWTYILPFRWGQAHRNTLSVIFASSMFHQIAKGDARHWGREFITHLKFLHQPCPHRFLSGFYLIISSKWCIPPLTARSYFLHCGPWSAIWRFLFWFFRFPWWPTGHKAPWFLGDALARLFLSTASDGPLSSHVWHKANLSSSYSPVRSGLGLGGAETECLFAFHGQL